MNIIQNLLLNTIGSALFGGVVLSIDKVSIKPLIIESKAQAVFPLLFATIEDQVKDKLSPEEYAKYSEEFLTHLVGGTQNFAEHGELHELMTANDIPYVVMKGLASSSYYRNPSLRNMGDVDFLVQQENFQKAGKVLEDAGFVIDHGDEDDSIHIAYHRSPQSIWELHRTVNGIPNGKIGESIQKEMNRVIITSVLTEIEDVICRVPDGFHHGLILLLHTASHLTSEGVGLRHMCDWAVFASSFSDSEFREIFEKKLKIFGLWRFAQVLTLLGIRYLCAPKRVWAIEAIECHEVDDKMLHDLMNDILSGGNFGTKDRNRYREIKYISDRDEHTVHSGGIISQGIKTLNNKVYSEHGYINKHRILLPLGWILEGGEYVGLLFTGKRKSSDTKNMLKEASKRKKLYSKLDLFN